jgi:hypothetical protein
MPRLDLQPLPLAPLPAQAPLATSTVVLAVSFAHRQATQATCMKLYTIHNGATAIHLTFFIFTISIELKLCQIIA